MTTQIVQSPQMAPAVQQPQQMVPSAQQQIAQPRPQQLATPSKQEEPYGGPMLILTYAHSGRGKTVADMFSFGPSALCVGEPGGFRVAATVCGIRPKVVQIMRINDASQIIANSVGQFSAMVIDDFSLVADTTFSLTERMASGFTLFGMVRSELLYFRFVARRSNYCHVAVNCHERPPHIDQLTKNFILGGPKLPGRMPEDLPGAFDSILRVVPAPWKDQPIENQDGVPALFKLGWPYVYQVGVDSSMVTKDRLDIIQGGIGPMNSAEMMRARGYVLPRTVPWQEEFVEAIAQRCFPLTMTYPQPPLKEYLAILGEAKHLMLTRLKATTYDVDWTLRDAIARTWIRHILFHRSVKLYGV